ncbi:SCO family protein [Novosphingobium sp. TH158]|uniref:SCO family protein n=1 Tax=Novosphingobium sp. TH158 TaxID=2067455 RepID=UPI000C7E2C3C|nr:SCO family protein [Novosphingobium sp. TH158]PLK26613.1 SCO family protein [Novosphingobium sp. TH158]
MNRRAMRKTQLLRPLFALALVAATAACGGPSQPPLSQAPLAGARIGGDFTLTDSTGKRVSWADFAGKWRTVYFGYTYCPDACPLDMTVLMQGVQKYAEAEPALAAKLQPVFVSIDPERDTPQRVGEFAGAFKPPVVGLTGTRAEIDAAAKAFAVYHARGETVPGGYLMDHSRVAYLFDPQGKPVAVLPIDKGIKEGPAAVAAELKLWVR